MSSANQTLQPNVQPNLPRSSVLQRAQFVVGSVGVIVSIVALVTRPEVRTFFGGIFSGVEINIAPPSYDPTLARILHGVQAAVILGFVLIHRTWLHQIASKLTDTVPVAKKTLEQFTAGWMYMWYGWLALYIWFFLAAAPRWSNSPSIAAVSDVLDVVSGFAIWWCFLVLDMPSVKLDGQPNRDKEFREAVWLVAIAGALCACLGAGDRLFDWNHVGVVVGLYNALAIAFFTGRLGSHYIGMSRWILLCLYTYSMLQLFYSFLPLLREAVWTPVVFLLALIFKMILAYAGSDMMQHGGLQRYLDAAQSGKLNPTW
jgi:hypothetical protein